MSGRISELMTSRKKKKDDRDEEEEEVGNSDECLNDVPGLALAATSNRLSSRVTFSSESVAIDGTDLGYTNVEQLDVIKESDDEDGKPRVGWDNKVQFLMGVISYAVGLGNVWRFPYLCQAHGGGAFLIPYCLMMLLEGMPLFLVEMGIGQRLRTGPIGVWNAIHPYLGGIGVVSAVVSFLVALYYNVIITWCLYYLYSSFQSPLPWAECPVESNGSIVAECARSTSPTTYYWYREAVDTSDSLGDLESMNWHMTVCLIIAWIIVYLCVMKGIKTSGKVMYVTATFPYLVTTIFLVRSITLTGAGAGIMYMFTPDLARLLDPKVWLDAATQIFYSMGLGFGGLIAFSSYNPIKNNVKRDVIILSIANIVTSLYTALVVFCVLGFMGHNNYIACVERDMDKLLDIYPKAFGNRTDMRNQISIEKFIGWMESDFQFSNYENMRNVTDNCNYQEIISKAAEGTGLAFIVFTEAIVHFPFPPLWAVMFFLMLLMLGLGSMFGTLEGVITSLFDMKLFPWLKKPVLTGILCTICCLVGLIFVTRAGEYWVKMFDEFAGSYALMAAAFFELIAVVYVYGYRRFSRDVEFMTGEYPSRYWQYTWRFISPAIMFFLFTTSLVKSFMKVPTYFAYDADTATTNVTPYPVWSLCIAFALVAAAMIPVPFVWFVRKFKIWKFEGDIPAASKRLGSTPSTTYMFRASQQSFNRIAESTASELQTVGLSTNEIYLTVPTNRKQ